MDLPIKTRAALFWMNLFFGTKNTDTALALDKKISELGSVLFLLPAAENYIRVVRIFLQSIHNALGPYPAMKIEYALAKKSLISYGTLVKEPLIVYSSSDLNYWGLPKRELLNKCGKLDLNAAIDLNPEFNPIAVTLMQAAKADVKIGYYSNKAERYYNILIDRKNTDFLERGNRYIIQLLGLN
tara:strand:- start:9 stop:560 length:552 start_codon:yes stop_codon:yes gene_type:complete